MRRIVRVTFSILGTVLLAYLALVAMAYAFQGRLIYPVPPTNREVPPGYEAVRYNTADGLEIAAGYRPASAGMPTLLFFHGNGADWQSTAWVTDALAAEGYGVLAAEYRGYGGNTGSPSELGLYEDARGAWRFLRARGVAEGDIVLVGNSIGSGVATHLATEVGARALVLISPFDSLEETAARLMRWLPVRLLLRDRYANAEKLPTIDVPILILHGEEDTLIGLDQARALAAANDQTKIITYSGWGHDLIVHEPIQEHIARFLETF